MDIAALKASAEKATPGPWRVDPSYCVYAGEPEHGTRQDVADNAWHNAEHIALANPTSILSMIARLEALEEALREVAKTYPADAARLIHNEHQIKEIALRALEPTP